MRLSLECRLDDEVLAFFTSLDGWAVKHIEEHAERLCKRPMMREHVATGYHPRVRRREGYDPLL